MNKPKYRLEPIPTMRRFAVDAGHMGRRRHIIHGLLEVDVSGPRAFIRRELERSGERLSFTAYLIHCLARAVEEYPHLRAYRDWRERLVIFDEISVNGLLEMTTAAGKKAPVPHIFRALNGRSWRDIHAEMRAAQTRPAATEEVRASRALLRLPGPLRRTLYRVFMRFPVRFHRFTSPVLVSAVGMFGQGGGWGIPMANFTLSMTVGGISKKPWVVGEEIVVREILDVTISIDHDIVDGAPAARFVQRLRELIETAYLDEAA